MKSYSPFHYNPSNILKSPYNTMTLGCKKMDRDRVFQLMSGNIQIYIIVIHDL